MGANLSILASLMQGPPGPVPQYNPREEAQFQAQLQSTRTGNETALIKLAQLKQSQASEEEVMAAIQRDPSLQALLFGGGGPILGSLGTAAGGPAPGPAPGPGPITQSPLGGGPAQQMSASPDASRYANVSPQGGGPIPPDVMAQTMPTVTPPQGTPTLATIGPQGGMPGAPQGPMQAPQNPLLEMARKDPRAALLLQQQMQGQQDRQWKMQEQQLKMGTTILDALGRRAQGATDQASWDLFIQDAAQIDPRLAARLPRVYSKEAREQVIAQALDVKETLQARIDESKVAALIRGQDVELAKARQMGGKVNYEKDASGNVVAVPEYAPGGGPVQSRPVLGADGQPIKSLEGQKLTSEQQRHLQTVEGGLRTHIDTLLQPLYAARDAIGRIEQSADTPSAAGDLALITAFMQMIDPRTGVKDAEFRNAQGAGGILDRVQGYIGKLKQGTLLDKDVRADFLQRARKLYEQYDKDYGQVKQQYRDLTSRMGGNPANVVLEAGSTVAKTPGGLAQAGAGSTTATGPATFDRADFLTWRRGAGKTGNPTQADVEAYFQARGLKRR